jgi:hypothetical protein
MAHAGLGLDATVAPSELEEGENLGFLWHLQVVRHRHPSGSEPSRMPEHPYLQWPAFRRSVVAAFQRSLTPLASLFAMLGCVAPNSIRRVLSGWSKPDTFDFLEVTHMCSICAAPTRNTGRFIVKRRTIRKRLTAQLQGLKAELRQRWHVPVPHLGRWLRSVGLVQLLRSDGQHGQCERVSQSRAPALVSCAAAPEPAPADDLGSLSASGQAMASQRPYPASALERALRR